MKTKITPKLYELYKVVTLIAVTLMCFSVTDITAQVVLGYEFTNDMEGWDGDQVRCSTAWNSAGYLDATTTGENDPFFFNTTPIVLDTSNVNFLELGVQNGTSATSGTVILIIDGAPNANIPFNMTPNSTSFETLVVDLSTVTNFSNSLVTTNVRIDPNNNGAAGTISFDYLRFTETTTVIDPISITVSGPTAVTTNETAQFTTSFTPSNTTFQSVDYSVNDMAIATIDSSGLLFPLASGIVTVTATTTDGTNLSDTQNITITQGPNTIIGWEFDTDDEGWNQDPQRCSTAWNSDGYLDVTTTGENDPLVRNATSQPFGAFGANFLEVRVQNGTASDTGQIIFFVQGGGVRTANFPMTPNSTEFETVVVDLPTTVNNWSGSDFYNDIRLDANIDGSLGVISFDYFRFTNESSLSVESQELLDTTIMYPNPVRQGQDVFVNLERFTNTDRIGITVNDIAGKLIYTKEILGGRVESISTNNFSAGVYLVSVKNEKSLKRFKILVN